jgi:hypothetical protein
MDGIIFQKSESSRPVPPILGTFSDMPQQDEGKK